MGTQLNKKQWTYAERIYVPWWYGICAAIIVGLLTYEVHIAFHDTVIDIVTGVILGLLALWCLVALSRTSIGIDENSNIHVSTAHIAPHFIRSVFIVEPEMKSAALGRQSDPMAFVVHRGWVKRMILLTIDDAEDPTPYWIFSSRHPDKFIASLPDSIERVHST